VQGWNMGLRDAKLAFPESAEALDQLIEERIEGDLKVGLSRLRPVAEESVVWHAHPKRAA